MSSGPPVSQQVSPSDAALTADPAAPVPGSDEPPASRKFPCPGCGAKLDFNPSQRELKCPYCGYAEAINPSGEAVRERDWNEYWANANAHGAVIEGRSSEVQCRVCAAVVLLEDKVVTDTCPYCASDLENKPIAAREMIPPESILPFKIDHKRAVDLFRNWLSARWFAPRDLRQIAALGKLNGVYVPFWTYDSMTYSAYTGQRGDNYQEMETYVDQETYFETDSNGQQVARTRPVTKTRMVTKIRWSYAAGNVEHFFDDVLVCGSKGIPGDLIRQLEPWDLKNLEGFQPHFLAGFQTERYTTDLKEGFEQARGIMDGHIRVLCCQDIGGDHQQLHTVNTQHTAITFKHLLQPVWLAPYKYRDKTYRILINARTGEVVGTRPYSFWRLIIIILIIIAIIAAIAGISALVGAVGHAMSDAGTPTTPSTFVASGGNGHRPIGWSPPGNAACHRLSSVSQRRFANVFTGPQRGQGALVG